jgi:hypothetical protein
MVSTALLGVGLLGCHHDRERTVVYEQPVYAEPEAPPGYVVVPDAPPQIIVEQPPPAPAPGYIFVEGYWHWDGHHYMWRHGRWARPPHGGAVWIGPNYERYDGHWRYERGHWGREEERREHERREHRDRN